MTQDIASQIQTEVSKLAPDVQLHVLNYVRSLERTPPGTPGSVLMRHFGILSPEDGAEMMKAIEEGCGQVDLNEW